MIIDRSGYDAVANAQNGIQFNLQNLSVNAENSNTDMTQNTANQIVAQNGVNANVQAIQTSDTMTQSLLDIQA